MLDSEGDLSGDLAKLMNLQIEMYNSSQMGAAALASPVFAGWEDRIKDYLKRVGEIARKHNCKGYTITVGIPWGVSASFNFEVQGASSLPGQGVSSL